MATLRRIAEAVLSCLALIVGSDVLGYGAFNVICVLWDRAARLTPTFGRYHLALALDDAGLARMVINPKAAKRFAEAMQTRTKTVPSIPWCWLRSPSAALHALAAPRPT